MHDGADICLFSLGEIFLPDGKFDESVFEMILPDLASFPAPLRDLILRTLDFNPQTRITAAEMQSLIPTNSSKFKQISIEASSK